MTDSPSRALDEKTLGRPRAWGAYLEAPNRFAVRFAKLQAPQGLGRLLGSAEPLCREICQTPGTGCRTVADCSSTTPEQGITHGKLFLRLWVAFSPVRR